MKQVIPFGTAAANREVEFKSSQIPASLILDTDGVWSGTETIPAYYVGHDGIRKTECLDANGSAFVFSPTNKVLPVYFPCRIRLEKPITVAAVGINQFDNQ